MQLNRQHPQFNRWLSDFRCLTGFGVEVLPAAGTRQQSSVPLPDFCRLLRRVGGCRDCPKLQTQLLAKADRQQVPAQAACPGGIVQLAVPIIAGARPVAVLFGGKVRLRNSSPPDISEIARRLGAGALAPRELRRLSVAYHMLSVYGRAQLAAAVRLLQDLAGVMARSLSPGFMGAPEREPVLVLRAREVILRHDGGRLTTESVARALKLNPSYFCRAFRRASGLTFHAYLAKMRVEAAATALRNSEQSITSAGFSAGFQSSSDFNRVFKAVLGITPSEFRAKAKG